MASSHSGLWPGSKPVEAPLLPSKKKERFGVTTKSDIIKVFRFMYIHFQCYCLSDLVSVDPL